MKLNSGQYWIGDPEFILMNNNFTEDCDLYYNKFIDDAKIISSKFRDVYNDYQTFGNYDIKIISGYLGIALINNFSKYQYLKHYGLFLTFDTKFNIEFKENKFKFGPVILVI